MKQSFYTLTLMIAAMILCSPVNAEQEVSEAQDGAERQQNEEGVSHNDSAVGTQAGFYHVIGY